MSKQEDPLRVLARLLIEITKGIDGADATSVLECLSDTDRRDAAIAALAGQQNDDMDALRLADDLLDILRVICLYPLLTDMISTCLNDPGRFGDLKIALAGPQEEQPWEQYARIPDVLSDKDIRKLLAATELEGASYSQLARQNAATLSLFLRDKLTTSGQSSKNGISPRQLAALRLTLGLDGEPQRTHTQIAEMLGYATVASLRYTLVRPRSKVQLFVSRSLTRSAGWDADPREGLSEELIIKLMEAHQRHHTVGELALGLRRSLKDTLTAQELATLRELLESYGAVLEFRQS